MSVYDEWATEGEIDWDYVDFNDLVRMLERCEVGAVLTEFFGQLARWEAEARAARMVDLDADDPTGIPPAFRDAPPEIRMRFAEQTNRELRRMLHAVERDRQRADDALRAAKKGGGDGG